MLLNKYTLQVIVLLQMHEAEGGKALENRSIDKLVESLDNAIM